MPKIKIVYFYLYIYTLNNTIKILYIDIPFYSHHIIAITYH